MGEELKRMHTIASSMKSILLKNKNVDILLYLAKYSPKVTEEELAEKFGKPSIKGLTALREIGLVEKRKGFLFLTNEGIFQVDGLLTMAA